LPADALGGICPLCLLGVLDGDQPPGALRPRILAELSADENTLADSTRRRFGDYELLEEVARGGMGVVYKARQLKLNRVVAVKMILSGRFAGRSSVQRFRGEAAAAGVLQHPNIVAIHEIGMHEGQHFFSMDYVEGQNLAQLVGHRPLPAPKAARYAQLIAQAIHYAHGQGILHRDLKPSNVLVEAATDQPRVTDFGLARWLEGESSLTISGQVLGSPNFMPPEQAGASRGKVSRQSDAYGLGGILYFMLTARAPSQGETLEATLHQALQLEPIAPRLLNSGVPFDLQTICLKCLEKEPAKRYATAQALADDLGRFLGGEPVNARPVTRVERAWRWCRRKPALATLGALVLSLLALLAIGAPIAAFRINRERQRAEGAQKNEAKLRQTAEAQAYTADMNVVLQAWKDGNLTRAQDLLRAHVPKPGERDLRGFEWRYLWKLCQDESLYTIQCGTNDPVWRLASSPAHGFVTACGNKAVRLLDPATGRELQSFPYPNPEATNTWHLLALASGATNLLAAHRADGVVGLWDFASKTWLMTFRAFPHKLGALALSLDGNLLAAGEHSDHGRTIALWDISSRTNAPRGPVWSRELDVNFWPSVLKFSPDGQTLVANGKSIADGTLGAWEVKTGRELARFPKQSVGFINDVAFSPDGTFLAASGVDGRINIWDFTNRTVKFYFDGHLGPVKSLTFSPDGGLLASSGDDGTIRIWDIPTHQPAGMFRDPLEREVLSVVFAPDQKSIFSTTGEELKIWSSEPHLPAAVIETHQAWGWPAISPDGKWLVTMGAQGATKDYSESESAKVWDLASRQQRLYLVHKNRQAIAPVFSPDSKLFALGGEDRIVGLWETALWEKANLRVLPFAYLTNDFEVGSICFSPDGKIMATAGLSFYPEKPSGATNRLAFWEVGSWRKLHMLESAGAGATEWAAAATVAFSNDGRLLAIGYRDGWIRLWDFKQRRLLSQFKGHGSDIYGVGVSFSGDDRWLASVSLGNSTGTTVVLFDLADREHLRPVLMTKAGLSWSAIFPPDNKSLVTSGNDGLIKFWNLETLKVALTLEHSHGPGVFITFSRDGNLLVSQDANGTVKLWTAPQLEEIEKATKSSR
jgi:WD40 repeat protein/tRNA A-37 threonylcarbamoyl transferase component Bud32